MDQIIIIVGRSLWAQTNGGERNWKTHVKREGIDFSFLFFFFSFLMEHGTHVLLPFLEHESTFGMPMACSSRGHEGVASGSQTGGRQ